MKYIGVLIGIVIGSLVIGTSILLLLPQAHNWVFAIEVGGCITAIYAAYEANRAHKELEEIGLLASKCESVFCNIFDSHLVKHLEEYRDRPGKLYLLLSTPAYGYAVVEEEQFQRFKQAITGLHKDSDIEIIFFYPDAHFHYWSNILLWSFTKREKAKFASNFGKQISEILKFVRYRNFKIWLAKETTVRLFAFKGKEDKRPPKNLYLLLTDRFSIHQDQYAYGFKVRSVPILSTQIKEYVEGENSYFDRIKECPYTLKVGRASALRELASAKLGTNGDLLDQLILDYVFGRTLQREFGNFEGFKHELQLFLKEARNRSNVLEKGISDEQIVKELLDIVNNYFLEIFTYFPGGSTETQTKRINFSKNKLLQLTVCGKNNSIEEGDLDGHWESLGNELDKLIYCLYNIICSGFGESSYAKTLLSKGGEKT